MSEKAVVSINLNSGEIRLEGSEAFVTEQLANLEELLATIGRAPAAAQANSGQPLEEPVNEASSVNSETDEQAGSLNVPEVFGEWLHSFRDDISDQEKALITAYFVQSKSEGNEFKTSEVTKFLSDHGIKLSNASSTLKQIERKKLIFQTRKPSKISYKRVSQDGVKHLLSLRR
ncbi:hypothetical protein [Desulfonatronovibrio hydrogenovorans]|uniref:hypothetical protein n=1 Tax=Desulfonatronovibrio hydrogenovorans TaxID=53245 RepID=UPI00048D5D52|nr:hypothetical protein [Desulfonatronovibrio hydrogenovorans]